jgi:hypothetical protein
MSEQMRYAFHLDSGEEVGGAMGSSTARYLAMDKALAIQEKIHVYLINTGKNDYMFTIDYKRI